MPSKRLNPQRLSEHLEKLKTFKVVTELRSVRKAADVLRVTQPAVSRTLRVLEDVLECQLLLRSPKGIQLTDEGQRLYDYASSVFESLERFGREARGEDSEPELNPLRIATYDFIACNVVVDLLVRMQNQEMQALVRVQRDNSNLLADLIADRADCAIVAEPRKLRGLNYKKIHSEDYSCFVSQDFLQRHADLKKSGLNSLGLKLHQLIAMPSAIAGAHKNIDRLLWESGARAPLVIDSYGVGLRMAQAGLGIAILPRSPLIKQLRRKELIELRLKDVARGSFGRHDIYLVWTDSASARREFAYLQKNLPATFQGEI